jgi:peptide/nickel transport system permease protein
VLEIAWWMTLYPGLAILITVLAYNLMGEGIRDALDPRLRQTRMGRMTRLGR